MELQFEAGTRRIWRECLHTEEKRLVELEGVVPDVSDDVGRIAAIRCTARMTSKELTGRGLRVTGEVEAVLLCITETADAVQSGRLTKAFETEIDAPGLTADEGQAFPRVLRAEGRVLNPRKLGVSAELGVEVDGAEANARYEALLHFGHWFIPGAEELLRTLAPDYDLYLASNGVASVQHSRIASAGIAPYFKGVFISEEMGAVKPQREYFEACFRRIPGFDPSRALMVGDSLTSDVRGGINAGIRTCWLNYNGKPGRPGIMPDYEIRAITELPALLARIAEEAEA